MELALREFTPRYRRATVMQASLAILGGLAGVAAWLSGNGRGWLLGGVLLAAVVPYTLIGILPTNHELMDLQLGSGRERAKRLLTRWGRLHAVRGVLSGVAFVIFVVLLKRAVP